MIRQLWECGPLRMSFLFLSFSSSFASTPFPHTHSNPTHRLHLILILLPFTSNIRADNTLKKSFSNSGSIDDFTPAVDLPPWLSLVYLSPNGIDHIMLYLSKEHLPSNTTLFLLQISRGIPRIRSPKNETREGDRPGMRGTRAWIWVR